MKRRLLPGHTAGAGAKWWDETETRVWSTELPGWPGSGQFFVCFVIHLQTKLELFILQQNAVLFSTARFFWQVIAHQEAGWCEIKIQLFLIFRWHDLFITFSNREGGRGFEASHHQWDLTELQWREGSKGGDPGIGAVILKCSTIVILRCHS